MDQNNSQILCILFTAVILYGCSAFEEKSCSKCKIFFSENDYFEYPERMLEYTPYGRYVDNRDSAVIEKKEITYIQKRLLTPREFKDMESLLFCFVGKERDFVLSYFKDFKIADYSTEFTIDTDSSFTFIFTHVCEERKGSSEDIYKCYSQSRDKEIAFEFYNIDGKGVYLGNYADSLYLQNCLEN